MVVIHQLITFFMKNIILITIFIVNISIVNAQDSTLFQTSKISTELNKKQITHSIDSWQIASIKGTNNTTLTIDAIKYKNLNNNIILEGVRLSFNTKNNIFYIYVDQDDYSEIMVVINQMQTEYKSRKKEHKYGNMSYKTLTNIEFGFNYTIKNSNGYISIKLPHNKNDIIYISKDIDSFLNNFLSYINIASKKLYMPENIRKSIKVKNKKNINTNIINIDDI